MILTAKTAIDPRGIISELESAARSAYPPVLLRESTIMSVAVSETATDQRYRALLVVTASGVPDCCSIALKSFAPTLAIADAQ